MKVIQINTSSSSLVLKNYEEDIYKGWYAQVALQTKKNYPQIDEECWTPERKYEKEKSLIKTGIKFRVFPSTLAIRNNMELSFAMIKALNKEIEKAEKEDYKLILHIHEYHSWQAYLILLLIKESRNVKIICQHHGGRNPLKNLKKYPRLFLAFPLIALTQTMENILFKKADLFYPLSDEEEHYLKNISKKIRIRFQTMGIEDKYFEKEDRKKLRKKLHLNPNKKYVLFLGRLKTTKGVKELLDSIKDQDLDLLLIGEGQDSEKYRQYAKEKNISNATFLGAIYDNKKLDYLAACDCLILPSYTEGAPVVLMEAIARNTPVIATNVGGIPKMIKNNREGLIIPPKSASTIKEAIKTMMSWNKKDIRSYGEKYRWKTIIKDTIKDYELL